MSRHILMYIKARLGISRHILGCQGISWRVKANKTQGVAWHGTFGGKQLWHLIFFAFLALGAFVTHNFEYMEFLHAFIWHFGMFSCWHVDFGHICIVGKHCGR